MIALAYILEYLTSFALEDVLSMTEFFGKFTERHYMLLNANTLINLYVLACIFLLNILLELTMLTRQGNISQSDGLQNKGIADLDFG